MTRPRAIVTVIAPTPARSLVTTEGGASRWCHRPRPLPERVASAAAGLPSQPSGRRSPRRLMS